MINCIVLAAGLSSRFNSPKQLVDFNGQPVINVILSTILHTKIDHTIIVLGADKEIIEPQILKHKNIHIVYNKDYILGQTSSFKTGLQSIENKNAELFLWPVDYPFIQATTIDALVEDYQKTKPKILIPTFNNKKGHPPLFDKSLKEEILELDNSVGLNTLIHRYDSWVKLCPVLDESVLLSFNTRAEWERIKAKVKSS